MPISRRPPLVCIGIAPQRYSHQLIEKTGEFVVNSPSISLEKEMHYCGLESWRRVNKWKETGHGFFLDQTYKNIVWVKS